MFNYMEYANSIDLSNINKIEPHARSVIEAMASGEDISATEVISLITLLVNINKNDASLITDILSLFYRSKPSYKDDVAFRFAVFTELSRLHRMVYVEDKDLVLALKRFHILNTKVDVDLSSDIDIDFPNMSPTWAKDFIVKYKNQIYNNTYPSDVIHRYFETLYTFKNMFSVYGISNYGAMVLYFGINNIGMETLSDARFKETLRSISKTGSFYTSIISVIGEEEFDNIEATIGLIG